MQAETVDSSSIVELLDTQSNPNTNTQKVSSSSKKHLEELRKTNYCLICFNYCEFGRYFALEEEKANNFHDLADISDLEGSQASSLRDKFGLAIILLNALQLIAIVREITIIDDSFKNTIFFLSIFTRGFGVFDVGEIVANVLTIISPILIWATYIFLQAIWSFQKIFLFSALTLFSTTVFLILVLVLPGESQFSDVAIAFIIALGAVIGWVTSLLFISTISITFLSTEWTNILWKYTLCVLELLIVVTALPVGNLVALLIFNDADFQKKDAMFLGSGIIVMVLQLILVTIIAATSNIQSTFQAPFWKRFIYIFFCRCGYFRRLDFASSDKIRWPFKKNCWAFPIVILFEGWILIFIVKSFELSEEELDFFNNVSENESHEVLEEIIVLQSLSLIAVITFTTLCLTSCGNFCKKRKERKCVSNPYKKDMHLWFAIISRVGAICLIILSMLHEIYTDFRQGLALIISLFVLGFVIIIVAIRLQCGLFCTTIMFYQTRLRSCFSSDVINDNSKDQVDGLVEKYQNKDIKINSQKHADIFLQEYMHHKIRIRLESWYLLTPNQKLYALSQIQGNKLEDNEAVNSVKADSKSQTPNCFVGLCICSRYICFCRGRNFENFEYLNLSAQPYLSSKLIRNGGSGLENLVCLEITGTIFTEYSWKGVVSSRICGNVQRLIITSSKFGDNSFEIFCEYLIHLKYSLKFLNLSNCDIRATDTGNLIEALNDLNDLKYFQMQNNRRNIRIAEVVKAIKLTDNIIIDIQGTSFPQAEMFECLAENIIETKVKDIEILLCSSLNDEEEIEWKTFEPIALLLWLGAFKKFVFNLRTEKWLRNHRSASNTRRDQVILNHIKGVAKILNRDLSFNYNIVGELFDDALSPRIAKDAFLKNRYLNRTASLECFIAGILMAYAEKDRMPEKKLRRIDAYDYVRRVVPMQLSYLSRDLKHLYDIDYRFWEVAQWRNLVGKHDVKYLQNIVNKKYKERFPSFHNY